MCASSQLGIDWVLTVEPWKKKPISKSRHLKMMLAFLCPCLLSLYLPHAPRCTPPVMTTTMTGRLKLHENATKVHQLIRRDLGTFYDELVLPENRSAYVFTVDGIVSIVLFHHKNEALRLVVNPEPVKFDNIFDSFRTLLYRSHPNMTFGDLESSERFWCT